MTKAPDRWQNRITHYGEEDPSQLLAHPQNAKIHPKTQQDALGGALSELGWLMPVVVNQRTGHLLDGHARVGLAISRNEPSVPVAYVDLSEDQEALALATIDPIGALAVHDQQMLDDLLREVSTGDAALQTFLDALAVKEGIIPPPDPLAEWQGMPEFEQQDRLGIRLIVHFENEDDRQDFGRLIGQPLHETTKDIWHPARKPQPRPTMVTMNADVDDES